MAEDSKIEWTTHTFNPWRGCTKVSPGCKNCYAETLSGRNPKTLGVWGPNGTRVIAAESAWREPLKWNRKAASAGERHRVFCASLADVFEGPETMPADAWPKVRAARVRLFHLINETPDLDWLLLTKRPENVHRFCVEERSWSESPPPNLWLGVSVENQAAADERIPRLLQTPAAVRFLSCEPLLGPVELIERFTDQPPARREYLTGQFRDMRAHMNDGSVALVDTDDKNLPRLHWVIVGGESGPGARPFDLEWARSLVRQCQTAAVPVFVKQLGAQPESEDEADAANSKNGTRFALNTILLKDTKGGNPDEWPADLRVREFPMVPA